MSSQEAKTDRLVIFSDGVFAVLITILVLDLKPPESATFAAFHALWPAAISYAISYLFIAIVWVNHHHLLRFANNATPRLIWGNFAHLFSASLIPFSTAWIADTQMAAIPVSLYAGIFLLVNVTYLLLCWEVVDRPDTQAVSPHARRMMRTRSLLTIGIFAAAVLAALVYPAAGMALICVCLLLYLRPDPPGENSKASAEESTL
jgi:uncharacterized membrane protein